MKPRTKTTVEHRAHRIEVIPRRLTSSTWLELVEGMEVRDGGEHSGLSNPERLDEVDIFHRSADPGCRFDRTAITPELDRGLDHLSIALVINEELA